MVGCGGGGGDERGEEGTRAGVEMDGSVGRWVGALGARDLRSSRGWTFKEVDQRRGGWEWGGGVGKRSCGLWSVGDWS